MFKMAESIVKKVKEVLTKTNEKIEEVIVSTVSSLESTAISTYNKVEQVKNNVKSTLVDVSKKVEDTKESVCTKVLSSVESTKESVTNVFCAAKGKACEIKTSVMTIKVETREKIKSTRELSLAKVAEIKSKLIFTSVNFKNTCSIKLNGVKTNLVFNMYVLRDLLIQANQRSYDGHIVNGKSEYQIAGINVVLEGLKKLICLRFLTTKQRLKDSMNNIYQKSMKRVILAISLVKSKKNALIVKLHVIREEFITNHLLAYDGYIVINSKYETVSTMSILEILKNCMKEKSILALRKMRDIVLEIPKVPVIYYNKLGELIESREREFFEWREKVITTTLILEKDFERGVQSPIEDVLLDARIFNSNSSTELQSNLISGLRIDTA